MAAKENWKLRLETDMGLISSSASPAAARELGGSSSRCKSGAVSNRICMIPALVTEGVKPTIAMNSKTTGMPSAVLSFRRRASSRTRPTRKPRCIPLTATMWEKPALCMAADSSSS